MKHLKKLLGLFAITLAVLSCQKEYSVENNPNNSSTAQWEFKEGGVQYKGPIDTATIDTLNNFAFLTIDGHAADGSKIRLQAFGPSITTGAYKTPFSMFTYVNGASTIYQTDQTAADSFSIVITKADSFSVTGTFSGKALNGTTPKLIVEGKFTAILKKSTVTPPSTDSGQVVLWSKAGCGGGTSTTPITVSVNNKSGQITSFTSTEPTTCNPAGSYNVKLPVGTYPWVAKCGTDSITGTVTVTKGGCTKVLVDFTKAVTGDYFPLTKNSNWTEQYEGGAPSDTVYTYNPGVTATIGGNLFTLQINDYGVYGKDSAYNRKSGNTYYQYVNAISVSDTTNGVITTIKVPAYQFRFLVDNLSAGATFKDSVTGSASQSGITIPVTFYFNSTITAVGATVTVAGKTYTNVIKVKTITTESTGGAIRNPEQTEYWYALNIGVIKFLDYYTDSTFTTPDDVWNVTRYAVY